MVPNLAERGAGLLGLVYHPERVSEPFYKDSRDALRTRDSCQGEPIDPTQARTLIHRAIPLPNYGCFVFNNKPRILSPHSLKLWRAIDRNSGFQEIVALRTSVRVPQIAAEPWQYDIDRLLRAFL
jgi:hypothetical protein